MQGRSPPARDVLPDEELDQLLPVVVPPEPTNELVDFLQRLHGLAPCQLVAAAHPFVVPLVELPLSFEDSLLAVLEPLVMTPGATRLSHPLSDRPRDQPRQWRAHSTLLSLRSVAVIVLAPITAKYSRPRGIVKRYSCTSMASSALRTPEEGQ